MRKLNLERKKGRFEVKPGGNRLNDASEDGQPHFWRLTQYIRYVSRGVCDCGAVRYFANDGGKFALQQAADLNKKKARKGAGHFIEISKKEERTMPEKKQLPDIPPRPGRAGRTIAKYYRDNLELIRRYLRACGEKETRKLWGIKSDKSDISAKKPVPARPIAGGDGVIIIITGGNHPLPDLLRRAADICEGITGRP